MRGGCAFGSRHPSTSSVDLVSGERVMAVENWPRIAERIAREHGGEPFTGDKPKEKWGFRLVASGVATRGREIELGKFVFTANPGWGFRDEVLAALEAEDGPSELTITSVRWSSA